MALYLLDTTKFTLFRRRHPRVLANMAAHAADVIGLTVVTVEEILSGWYARIRQAKTNADRAATSVLFADAVTAIGPFPISPYTEPALDRYDVLVRMRLNVGGKDLQIAAIALELGAVVVTNNVRDFGRVPGLVIEDWSA